MGRVQECDGCGRSTGNKVGFCQSCEDARAAQLREFEAVTAGDTHGSPELDADARKLEGMGLSAGATLADVDPLQVALAACIGIIETLSMTVVENQSAWEGEEDSVQEEHAELMERNRTTIAAYQRFAGVLASIAGGAHVDGE